MPFPALCPLQIQVIVAGVFSVMFKKKYNRCILISIWLLTTFSIMIAVFVLVVVGVTGYPKAVEKQKCTTKFGV